MNVLDLPNVVLIEIFERLCYEEVSKKRLVCRRFNQIAQQVLNGGFNKAVKQHTISFKRIKALLPRRESERRNHCLARHADILTSVETRISMLTMTYAKYMDMDLCCFIPGRVLDEIFRILRLISKTNKPLRPHEVLQELRDISSMAIEHFDEKIANNLKKPLTYSNLTGCSLYTRRLVAAMGPSSSLSLYSPENLDLLGDRLHGNARQTNLNEKETLPSTSKCILERQHPVGSCPEARTIKMHFKKLEAEYKKGIAKMHRMQQDQILQNRKLQHTSSTIAELRLQIVELKKRLEDVDAKNREISANIRHISGGDLAGSDEIENRASTQIESNDGDESENSSMGSSTAALAAKKCNKSSTKRRCDLIGELNSVPTLDGTENSENKCELQTKKPKLNLK